MSSNTNANKLAKEHVRTALTAAKNGKHWGWQEVSEMLTELGIEQTPNNLTTKQSRGAFKAADFLVMLRSMGVLYLDLSTLEIPGLAAAAKKVEAQKKARVSKANEAQA